MNDSLVTAEVVNLTNICSTFPEKPESEVLRENMVCTLDGLLRSNTEVIVVEGGEGVGKTTLLAQFARTYNQQTISAFVTNSSRYAWDPGMIAQNLHEQIQFALGNVQFRKPFDADVQTLLRGSVADLQKMANWQKKKYFFVIDGLEEVPTEERSSVEQIIELLPIGLSTFRFLLSGTTESLTPLQRGRVTLKPWALPPFSLDETIKYFSNIAVARHHFETIYKASNRGYPGRLASIKRLCTSTGKTADDVLDNLSDHAQDLLEKEWQSADKAPEIMQLALAALCFDTRPHTLASLAALCTVDSDKLQQFIETCTFLQGGSTPDKPLAFASYFKRFAAKKLARHRKAVFQRGIDLLMAAPECSDALNHLPYYLHESGEYDRLLEYLSGEHIGKLIECTQSWIPLHQKVDLGISTARKMKRGDHLMRFGLQRAAVSNLESCEHRRYELQAYVALGDFKTAYSVAQTAVAMEDRLHILAIIASAKRKEGLPVEPELKEQVHLLYSQIEKDGIGDRGVEIALDLLNCQPELAIDLVRASQKTTGSQASVDMALANLSIKTLIDNTTEKESAEMCAKMREQVHDPAMQRFVDTVSMLWGDAPASEVIAMISKWERPADQIYVLRNWTIANRRRKDASMIIEHALDTIIKTTDFPPNAKIYRELAMPLPFLESEEKAKVLIDRFDGVKATIAPIGPTEEFVWLQLLLAGAEYRYAKESGINRFTDIYFFISEINELATQTASLARLTGMLQLVDPRQEQADSRELHSTAAGDLENALRKLLTETADHYEAVEPALQTLTRSAPERALALANSLNTAPRRDRARIRIIKSLSTRDRESIQPEFVERVLASIQYPTNTNNAFLELVRGLRGKPKETGHLIPLLKKLSGESSKLSCPETRCEVLLGILEICSAHPDKSNTEHQESLRKTLKQAWGQLDGACERVEMGFRIVAEVGKHSPEFARNILEEVRHIRQEMPIDNPRSSQTYVACSRLAIRAFSGLIKTKVYGESELNQLADLIDRMPSAVNRAMAWTDVALRLYLDGQKEDFEKIVLTHVKKELNRIPVEAKLQKAEAIILAAPALYRGHIGTAEETINGLTQDQQDGAYQEICNFLMTDELPFEAYESNTAAKKFLPVETVWDICHQMEKIQADFVLYEIFKKLVESLEHKKNRNRYTREQLAEIKRQLNKLLNKFPAPNYIQHEGYRILAEAEIARFDNAAAGVWDNLIARARNLPNHSDQAFVLTLVAGAMPTSVKFGNKKRDLFGEAKKKIETLTAVQDRLDRYESLAKEAQHFDRKISRDALITAVNGSIAVESKDVVSTRKRLVDTAYRIDPAFAATLASGMDDDPVRVAKRDEISQQIQTLKLRDSIQNGKNEPLSGKAVDPDKKAEAAWMALKNLSSGRTRSIESEQARSYVQEASQFTLGQAYPILALVIESEVRHYKDTKEASTQLKPLFQACVTSAEMAFRISARMQSVESAHLSTISTQCAEDGSLIRGGERERALQKIRDWVKSEAKEFIHLCDPYFGPEDLDLVNLIRLEKQEIPIAILTSKKHQNENGVSVPWEEAYQAHWRLEISELDPGDVRIVIMGSKDAGALPIHDRWMVSASSGLRLGSSLNSIGLQKASEVSKIEEKDLPAIQALVGKYLNGVVKTESGEKLLPNSFYLSS